MSSFTIIAPSRTVKLNSKGMATLPFTVTNTARKPVRGTPKVIPLGSTGQNWVSLQNGGTRSFSPEQAQQFVVEINVPPNSPEGEYLFRLNISNEAMPEDDFFEGPPVAFEFKPVIVEPPPARPRWWIWILVGTVLVGGGVSAWLLMPSRPAEEKHVDVTPPPEPTPQPEPPPPPQKVKVPKLVGLPANKVSAQPATLVYRKVGDEHTGTQAPGNIAKQDPKPEAELAPGELVLYTVEAQSPFVGTWVPAPNQGTSVARYTIRQDGTRMLVTIFEKSGQSELNRGEVQATPTGKKLQISWRGALGVVRPPMPKVPPIHQQTLTLTSDGRLLVEQGTSKATFNRQQLIHPMLRLEVSRELSRPIAPVKVEQLKQK
jgi:hypothetical protein